MGALIYKEKEVRSENGAQDGEDSGWSRANIPLLFR
jgi:hypothetical protein